MTRKLLWPLTSLYCQNCRLPNLEAIVFDKDGTLADASRFLEKLAWLRVQRCLEAVQLQFGSVTADLGELLLVSFGVNSVGLDPDGLMAVGTGQANQQAAVAAFVQAGYPADPVSELVSAAFAEAATALKPKAAFTPPFAGTVAVLSKLAVSSLRVGVLSSDSSVHLEEFLTYYRLQPWIDGWQGTDGDDPAKPDPTLLYRLCERLKVRVANTVVIGDSWADLQWLKTPVLLALSPYRETGDGHP
ncbi:MAG: HAD family hydrolase [Leptolyngbyaceae cyanobacterium SM2_5_2]|nr:HAD family hydrolase [Leptolyngbyaceae cyanobacterium SM2_5_2]